MSSSSSKEQSYEIGQIVYVLSEKAEAIVPAIVVEEVLVKTLEGNRTSWKVAVGPPNKKQIIDSTKMSGEVYISLNEVKEVMMNRFTNFVDSLIEGAYKRTEAWYGSQVKGQLPKGETAKIDPAILIKSMEERENDLFLPVKQSPDAVKPTSADNLRQKLREMASVPEEEEHTIT